jgi:hypothetical protein
MKHQYMTRRGSGGIDPRVIILGARVTSFTPQLLPSVKEPLVPIGPQSRYGHTDVQTAARGLGYPVSDWFVKQPRGK